MKEKEEVGSKGTCPRCGSPINWVERQRKGGREYYVAVHYLGGSGGKEALRKCYLGPKEYAYVTLTHEGLGLTLKGMVEPKRVLDYPDSLLTALPHLNVKKGELSKLVDKLKLVLKALEERLREGCELSEEGPEAC